MRALFRPVLAVVALVLVLGACGDPAEAPPYQPPDGSYSKRAAEREKAERAEQAEREKAGKRLIEGETYWYVAPKGWKDKTNKFQVAQPFVDSASQSASIDDSYANSLTVKVLPAGKFLTRTLRENAGAARRQLRAVAVDVSTVDDWPHIDGELALHQTGTSRFGIEPPRLDQFMMFRGHDLYIATFIFASKVPADDRKAKIKGVLKSWHWTD